jgi:hypothetical protein
LWPMELLTQLTLISFGKYRGMQDLHPISAV